ncbi:STAS domain-containing protein [Micromonospora sp. WMMA1949]|uniref:STAS domain-containing protein n=1 Tax=unclassified Micromonospora TaxID=2617518 RepID=UPI0022B608C7|nr:MULTISPECIES: STAS domain-containing protein [unclassified Micromonospora]MCZ7429743.1 STAS domain-containing protein [Micromonospora sp. WMMA1949]WBC08593.1 STAS domain-containing protein [Micromonospora sp. WMMA1947]
MDRSDPAVPVVVVGGDLAYATAAPLRAEIDRLLAGRPTALVFDFGDLQFMDSTGLSVIVHAWREGQQAGTAIELRAVPRFLETILDLTGVTGLLDRSPVDDAPGHLAPGSAASA